MVKRKKKGVVNEMKVNFSINDELLERADRYAKNNYMSRSGIISLALSEFLNAREMATAIPRISYALKKMADEGKVDEDTLTEFREFEKMVQFMTEQMNK